MLASTPSRSLVLATAVVVVVVVALVLPWPPLGRLFGVVPLPPLFLVLLAAILAAYGLTAELVKHRFYRGPRRPG
jgi:Mg2+-importing ATPase